MPPRWSVSAAARRALRTSSACKVSIGTPVTAQEREFVLHAKALHGSPYDGHTLRPVITDLEELTGVPIRRIHGDKGYRGHNYPDRFKVWISGQVRRVTKAIRREMRRRAAIEPVIGHLKDDHRMRRNHLKGRHGDRINAGARRCRLQLQPAPSYRHPASPKPALKTFFTGDEIDFAPDFELTHG
jgi:hypothetical protein